MYNKTKPKNTDKIDQENLVRSWLNNPGEVEGFETFFPYCILAQLAADW